MLCLYTSFIQSDLNVCKLFSSSSVWKCLGLLFLSLVLGGTESKAAYREAREF